MANELIHLSFANVFQFNGVTIEWHRYGGPQVLRRKTWEPRNERNLSLRIWGIVDQFARLSKDEREKYRVM